MNQIDDILIKLYPNAKRINYSYKNKKLNVSAQYENAWYDKGVDGEAGFVLYFSSILVIGFSMCTILFIPNIIWANIVFWLIVVGWGIAQCCLFDIKSTPEFINVILINISVVLVVLMIAWQIMMSDSNLPNNLPYLNFLFKFHF